MIGSVQMEKGEKMRLIDADRLNVYKAWVEVKTDDDTVIYSGKRKIVFADDITDAPTVDAVEVVRCKDCKYASLTYDGECKYCQRWKEKYDGESVSLYLDGDFYCAFGERREDERTV